MSTYRFRHSLNPADAAFGYVRLRRNCGGRTPTEGRNQRRLLESIWVHSSEGTNANYRKLKYSALKGSRQFPAEQGQDEIQLILQERRL
jgi:hypothetical protein